MGKVVPISRLPKRKIEVFEPVNRRPTERCRLLVFDPSDGNEYGEILDGVAVQYALGEVAPFGYHVIETPDGDGPLLRYIQTNPDGSINVQRRRRDTECKSYLASQVNIIGRVFQLIRDFETGERWELIRGPAQEGGGELLEPLPIYDVSS